jgi:NAD(P)-dependent dehydrogenase (short-subunit alcohol dehydrogenase family)
LRGKVAVVTGASRGAGRAIAAVRGERGATVYVTGRTSRAGAPADVPGTVEDAADEVTARGGEGIPAVCDSTDPAQVAALFARVKGDHGRIDVLVNNAWGGYERMHEFLGPFWTHPVDVHWRGMFEAGVRAHLHALHHAVPLMLPAGFPAEMKGVGVCERCGLGVWPGDAWEAGRLGFVRHVNDCVAEMERVPARALVINTIAWMFDRYLGSFYYDVAKAAIVRMSHDVSRELRRWGVASVALAPGFMRTERVMAAHAKYAFDLSGTESPEYVGRAAAALAADPEVMRWTGRIVTAGGLAREYGFTDVDGSQPPPFDAPEGTESPAVPVA